MVKLQRFFCIFYFQCLFFWNVFITEGDFICLLSRLLIPYMKILLCDQKKVIPLFAKMFYIMLYVIKFDYCLIIWWRGADDVVGCSFVSEIRGPSRKHFLLRQFRLKLFVCKWKREYFLVCCSHLCWTRYLLGIKCIIISTINKVQWAGEECLVLCWKKPVFLVDSILSNIQTYLKIKQIKCLEQT